MQSRVYRLLLALFLSLPLVTIGHADMDTPATQTQLQPIAYPQENTMIVGIVPASAYPSCHNAYGDVLYITRPRHTPTVTDHNEVPTDGPFCTVPSTTSSAVVVNATEPLFIVPLTKEGVLSEQPCMIVNVPQQFCEIPNGSLLSAFPLV